MCYSVAYLEKKLTKLVERYQGLLPPGWKNQLLEFDKPSDPPVYYFVSGFSHPALPVFAKESLYQFAWGLIPSWAKDESFAKKIRTGTLNAVGETVYEKPSFRNSIRSRRGLLPVSGFFEWHEYQGKKYPYFIRLVKEGLFSLACIHDAWTNPTTGEIMNTFSIVTCPANPLMEIIHNKKKRMPLILDDASIQNWLNPETSKQAVEALIKPYDETKMTAYPVSRMLNYARNQRNSPEAIEPIAYPGLPPLPIPKA